MNADKTIRALLEYGIERFEKAGLAYGHGTANALDEAAWLILHAAGLPLGELNPHLDKPLTPAQFKAAKALLDRRARTRKPAGYLTPQGGLPAHPSLARGARRRA